MSPDHEQIDLAYRLLDLDLVDSEGIRCGKVDDLVLEGEPGTAAYVAAIRTGSGALADRLSPRWRRLARRIFHRGTTDIPSSAVEDFDACVRLNVTAKELGIATGDPRLAQLVGGEES
jgi:hypothetical protein